MNWLVNADDWVDARMFRPLVIKICQTLDWTQYQLNRNIWALTIGIAAIANIAAGNPVMAVFVSIVAAVAIGKAIFYDPMRPEPDSLFIRCLIYVLGLGGFFATGYLLVLVFYLFLLLAEYASKITHVPPAKPRSYSFGQLAQQA